MNVSFPKSKSKFTTKEQGSSFGFINKKYIKGVQKGLKIGDEVIIHPIIGVSQATKSYPAQIVVKEMRWIGREENAKVEPKLELCLEGIRKNKNWHGAVLNEYGFSRLELVQRNIKNTFLEILKIGKG